MKGLAYHQSLDSPCITTPVKDYILSRNRDSESSRTRVNKMSFEDDCRKSTEVVDLSDNKRDEKNEKESADAIDTLEDISSGENYEDEDVEATSTSLSGRQRKRVVTSESENDDEENCRKSTEVIDLSDNNTDEKSEKESADAMDTLEDISSGENYEDEDVEATSTSLSGRKRKRVIPSESENDDEDEDVEATSTSQSGLKRKRVITSESENDDEDEDNTPISILRKKMNPLKQEMQDLVDTPTTEENMSVRVGTQRRVSSRLKKQRVSKEISASSERHLAERLVGISTTGNAEDDETDEELESENESLDGFIVDDDSHETVSEKSDEICEEESDEETSYDDVMSKLRKDKKPKRLRWEYEADMLADFAKDPELCMKAVCVLYRFQTDDEKMSQSSHVCNGRGFNKFDATRGTRIGSFLTNGDSQGDLKKSVEELKSFEFEAIEICRALAERYWKQLFQIYNNREDPFFTLPPSP